MKKTAQRRYYFRAHARRSGPDNGAMPCDHMGPFRCSYANSRDVIAQFPQSLAAGTNGRAMDGVTLLHDSIREKSFVLAGAWFSFGAGDRSSESGGESQARKDLRPLDGPRAPQAR
jgi:hypothetical protein